MKTKMNKTSFRNKGWDTTKYKSKEHMMWANKLPQFSKFKDNYYVTVGRVGKTDDFYMNVTKRGRVIVSRTFDNFKDAKASAERYMGSRPTQQEIDKDLNTFITEYNKGKSLGEVAKKMRITPEYANRLFWRMQQ